MSPLLISTSLVHIMTKHYTMRVQCMSALNACTALQTRSLLMMLWLLSCCRRRRVTDPSFCFALHKIITKKNLKNRNGWSFLLSFFCESENLLWLLVIRLVEREAMSSRKRSRGARATASENGRSLRQKASSKSVYVDGLSGKDYLHQACFFTDFRQTQGELNSRSFLNSRFY